jgi:DNA ligase-1
MITVRYQRGVELPEHHLWLDPQDSKPFAFVSHAHSDHLGAHREVIVSRGTAALMRERLGGKRIEHVMEFGETREFNGCAVTLLAAGHIFGSAQSFVESEAGSLLYTGDFKLRPGLSAEATEWRHADTLIMETTYGLPRYTMPPTAETMERMVEFCREALAEDAVPVLLGYSLGKSQEILCALLAAGLTPMLHGAVHKLTEIYRRLRPGFPTGYLPYVAAEVSGKVLVCPPSANRTRMVTQIKRRRVAALTGWALDPGAIYRYQCDAIFPLTDHADYPDLVRYVELVQPKRVLTLHGFAAEFARDLRDRGVEAWPLTEAQFELALLTPRMARKGEPQMAQMDSGGGSSSFPPVVSTPPDSFARFAGLGEEIAKTTSKLRKVEVLAAYLRSLDEISLPLAAVYLTGRPFAQSDSRTLQTGGSIIRRALLGASGLSEVRLREISRSYADAGKTTFEALLDRTKPEPWSLVESRAFFDALSAARGPIQKGTLLQGLLARLTAMEASYVVKILTGDLRLGLKESLVEDALAVAFAVEGDDVREANMLLGDLGETALLARRGALATAGMQIFRPVKVMLASPEPTAAAIWERVVAAPAGAWAEDKFDGIRAQLHAADGRVEIFTRDLRPVAEQFADVTRAARGLTHRVIFDGEILAFAEGKRLTFFDLQKRLGRKTEDDLFLDASDVPVIFRAFDLLWLEGESLLRTPLAERREKLEALTLPTGIERAPRYSFSSAEELDELFRAARTRGNEGLIVKSSASLYTPGRRGLAWLKLKKELATLDVVVVGAEQGHGKRAHVLSDYTFAVRDDKTGELLTIGKAYSGLTDAEIEDLTAHFTATTISQHGRYRDVRPEIVLEIAFDSIQPSNRHQSGLAMRFPRIKAIRRDKHVEDIDTLSFARSLVG